jgi:hypothetical protein
MLQTSQRYPRARRQSYPSPAAVAAADGSMTAYFGPTKPADAQDGNWIQTIPGKGWFMLLRLYSPLEPFFTKTWRPSEVALVRKVRGGIVIRPPGRQAADSPSAPSHPKQRVSCEDRLNAPCRGSLLARRESRKAAGRQ